MQFKNIIKQSCYHKKNTDEAAYNKPDKTAEFFSISAPEKKEIKEIRLI